MEKEKTKSILEKCANNRMLPPLWKDKDGDYLYHSAHYDFCVLHDGSLYVMCVTPKHRRFLSSFTIKTLGELKDKAKYIGLGIIN